MLITVIVGILLTLIFGKITIKEIKEHVRKYGGIVFEIGA